VIAKNPGCTKSRVIREANTSAAEADVYLAELLQRGMLFRGEYYFRQQTVWRYFCTAKGVEFLMLVTKLEEMLK